MVWRTDSVQMSFSCMDGSGSRMCVVTWPFIWSLTSCADTTSSPILATQPTAPHLQTHTITLKNTVTWLFIWTPWPVNSSFTPELVYTHTHWWLPNISSLNEPLHTCDTTELCSLYQWIRLFPGVTFKPDHRCIWWHLSRETWCSMNKQYFTEFWSFLDSRQSRCV